jgi:hypothetical protein
MQRRGGGAVLGMGIIGTWARDFSEQVKGEELLYIKFLMPEGSMRIRARLLLRFVEC